MARPLQPISYVTATGTITFSPSDEPSAPADTSYVAGGFLVGPAALTAAVRTIMGEHAGATAEVRYGHWYTFTDTGSTLTDVLAAMLLTGSGHLDESGWDILADHIDSLPPPADGDAPMIR